MGGGIFRFKRFGVAQGGAAMKVGTDGVLLGAWCPMEHRPARVLDVGAGTGVVALMVAQRGEAWDCRVDAVEIDAGAAAQAHANFAASPWAERLRVYNTDIQSFKLDGLYDLVVSNPPYFSGALASPDARRNAARHDGTLSFEALSECAAAMLSDDGVFSAIVPFDRADRVVATARGHGLHLWRRLDVRPTPGHPPKRSLLALGRGMSASEADLLTVETAGRHEYSAEYRALTRDFYLKF